MHTNHHIQILRGAMAQSAAPVFVGAITDLSVTAFTDTTISLAWTNPDSTYPLDHFKIILDGVESGVTTDDSNSWTITGLAPSTTYTVQLIPVDDQNNEGGLSNSVSQKTDMRYFITTWETTNPDESITIPTREIGYNYRVDWGDGTVTTGHTANATHTYAVAGLYTVKISGDFPRIYFSNTGDKLKIKYIEQWGNIAWQSFQLAFTGCSNLRVYATDYPDLSSVETCAAMFNGCSILNPVNVIGWDTHSITNMNGMFHSTSFNQNIGQWNVENLITASNMFLNVTISTANYDAILIGWASQNLQNDVVFNGGNSKRSSASLAAYNTLVSTYGWTIVDGGLI